MLVDRRLVEAYFNLRLWWGAGMARAPRQDLKRETLARDGALNPHPEVVRDPLFADNPFFDSRDLIQVRYEMVRRHQADGIPISDVAASFGVSRPTFYKAQDTLAAAGLAGLLPQARGPKGGHKISAEVVAFVVDLKAASPELTTRQCLAAVEARFGIKVHRRSLERALARKKKLSGPP
jgi:transposase